MSELSPRPKNPLFNRQKKDGVRVSFEHNTYQRKELFKGYNFVPRSIWPVQKAKVLDFFEKVCQIRVTPFVVLDANENAGWRPRGLVNVKDGKN